MEKTILNPVEGRGFSKAVCVTHETHKRVFISGAIAVDEDYTLIGENDMAAQTRYVYERIQEYLRDLGGTMDDIVRVRAYVTTLDDTDLWEYRDVREEFFTDPGQYPASSLVGVAGLVVDGTMVEVDAEAIIPDDGWDTTIDD